jgi:hypothetical protein
MSELLEQARAAIKYLAADRARRGVVVPDEQIEAAASLLADLWPVAARHGITSDQWGWSGHLPRAALDAIGAARKAQRGGGAR